jgi:pimeloyl-ACP methyl ester carboxylesterase
MEGKLALMILMSGTADKLSGSNTMDYSSYTNPATNVKEYMFKVSDGVSLKIIDFTPRNVSQEKPVILFVAGWISLISGWRGVLKVLTAEHRVIYCETREKQSSTVPEVKKVSFSIERLKLDIGEIIENIIPPSKKFIFAGSSLGASAILEHCASDKRKPLCAVLINPNTEFRFPKFLGEIIPALHPSLYLAVKPVIKWYLRNFRLDKKTCKEQIEKYENTLDCANPYKLKANALAIKNYVIWGRIDNINVPCLVMGATSDTLHATDNVKRLLKLIPDSTYIELKSNMENHSEKAGHVIVDYIEALRSKPQKTFDT